MSRIAALAEIVKKNDADAMLLTGEVNLIYALETTALEGQCLILADGTAILITDGRYTETAEAKLLPRGFRVLTRSNASGMYEYLQSVLDAYQVQKLLYEDDVLTVDRFAAMREKLPCSFLPIGSRILSLRARKSEEEIASIVIAQHIAEAALTRLLPELCEGMTEREAAARLNYYMAISGSEKTSFDTILLFGENTSLPHGVPGDRKLCRGDFILADFGAVYRGYHSDMTRTFAFGSATDEMRKVYDTVLRAQNAARAAACAGRLCNEMHFAAAKVIEDAGYGTYFTHALGHSVGLEIHEMPVAAPRCEEVLCDGIIMTDEPGIYIPGKFGVRIEDMLVISGDHPVTLTAFPSDFQILSGEQNG
ncbi:MAG: aminopeptidase P family protein [Oscillospiraceae bacterium]|nr:aminopeptidase P family protein [Oscillospiraceae bacterium]